METVLGFSLIGLLIFIIFFLGRKFFKKKKMLHDHEQEIILDEKIIHLGPFSGNPYKKLAILLAFSSSYLSANIDMHTIDNWFIGSWGKESLMIQKTSDNRDSNLFIEMSRPFCICTDPLIITPSKESNFNRGDSIEAVMTVNNFKPTSIVFKVDQVFENGDYLLRPKYYPSIRNAELIKIKFKQTDKLEDMIFNTRGMSNAMKQSERICFSEYELEISEDETTV
tara:strand:+ start:261 stop:935 length:675 start_codon:yes stop_codon:yes gene_type:complete